MMYFCLQNNFEKTNQTKLILILTKLIKSGRHDKESQNNTIYLFDLRLNIKKSRFYLLLIILE